VYTNKYNISNKQFIQTETVNSQYKMHSKTLWTHTQFIVSGDFPLGLVSFRVPSTVLSSHVLFVHPDNHHIFYKRYMNDLHFVLTYVIAQ